MGNYKKNLTLKATRKMKLAMTSKNML